MMTFILSIFTLFLDVIYNFFFLLSNIFCPNKGYILLNSSLDMSVKSGLFLSNNPFTFVHHSNGFSLGIFSEGGCKAMNTGLLHPRPHSVHNVHEPYMMHSPRTNLTYFSHCKAKLHVMKGFIMPEEIRTVCVPKDFKFYDFLRYPWHNQPLCSCGLIPHQKAVLVHFWLHNFELVYGGENLSFAGKSHLYREVVSNYSQKIGFFSRCSMCFGKLPLTI